MIYFGLYSKAEMSVFLPNLGSWLKQMRNCISFPWYSELTKEAAISYPFLPPFQHLKHVLIFLSLFALCKACLPSQLEGSWHLAEPSWKHMNCHRICMRKKIICHYLVMACSVFSLSSPAPPLLGCLLQTDSNLVSLAIYPAEGKGNRNLSCITAFLRTYFLF